MSQQLPLAIALHPSKDLADFLPQDNAPTLAAIDRLLEQREPQLFLWGPPASGRTHLLLGTCRQAERQGLKTGYLPLGECHDYPVTLLDGMENLDLLAIDDVHAITAHAEWELGLFNLYNRARERDTHLLFSADCAPNALALQLPDLRTRLAWGLSAKLAPLDDIGKQWLLQREAQQRGMDLPDDAARYILTHHERNSGALIELLDELDRASLAAKSKLSLRFVRNYLVAQRS